MNVGWSIFCDKCRNEVYGRELKVVDFKILCDDCIRDLREDVV